MSETWNPQFDPYRNPSVRSAIVRWLVERFFRPWLEQPDLSLQSLRERSDGLGRRVSRARCRTWASVEGGVESTWISDADDDAGVLLYLHGGGYVFGSPRSHLGIAGRLSAGSGLAVCLPDYRLAPEHQHPAALEDAVGVYRALLDRGTDPSRIAIAGDSAGGHLAACLLNELPRRGMPMPGAAALLSPVIDPSGSTARAIDQVCRDPLAPAVVGMRCLDAYFGATPRTDGQIDVLRSLHRRWPPTLIQAGGTECLREDARQAAAALRLMGVQAHLQVWPGQLHVFQLLHALVPEGALALESASLFLREHTGQARWRAAEGA